MSISNRKPGEKKESPAEPLKRSIAGTMKAIARKPDLEVAFASDRPALIKPVTGGLTASTIYHSMYIRLVWTVQLAY